MSKTAIIYTRVSTDEQARNNLSLQGQEEAAREYCMNRNIAVVNHFQDAGESAKSANRPQLQEAVAYCIKNSKTVDYFVVWKLDRFARNAQDHFMLGAMLRKAGIELRSVTEPIDTSAVGRLTETMLAGFAQFDNDVRGERSSAGMQRRIEEGGWTHGAPIGYVNHKDALGRPTLQRSEDARLVRTWLSEFIVRDRSLKEMNQLAWDMGLRSKSGKRLSYQTTINMLGNPLYAGRIRSKMLKGETRKGLHEGLITESEFMAIREKLTGKSRVVTTIDNEWPLRAFVRCAKCDSPLTGSASKGRSKSYPLYRCPNCRSRDLGHRVSVPKEDLHTQFEEYLSGLCLAPGAAQKIMDTVKQLLVDVEARNAQEIRRISAALEKLQDDRRKTVALLIEGKITVEEKLEQTAYIDNQIAPLSLKLTELNEDMGETEAMVEYALSVMTNLPKFWRMADEHYRRALQNNVFPEGVTYDFITGFGTKKLGTLYEVAELGNAISSNLVGVAGLEPATNRL